MADSTEGEGEQDKHCEISDKNVHKVKGFLLSQVLLQGFSLMHTEQWRAISSEAISLGE